MHEIRAFVGHSFSTHDKAVNQVFIDHFRTLENAYPNFSWDHAEQAEPVALSQKVLEKIEGKNVFIGICTRKEAVIAPESLQKPWYTSSLQVSPSDVAYKTSDWLIQEIGLAMGRKMSIILFLEEGVRAPGGLYGNVEFIPFNRDHPSDSFTKLLQMLSTLNPKTGAVAMGAESKPATEEAEKKPPAGEDREPKSEWTEEDFKRAAFGMIWDDNEEGMKRIDEAYRASKHAQGDAVATWEGELEYFRLLLDKKGNLNRVKELAEKHPKASRIFNVLGKSYETVSEYEKAAEAFIQAAAVAQTEKGKSRNLMSAALAYQNAGNTAQGLKLIEQAKALSMDQEMRSDLLPNLRFFAELEKNEDVQIALLEEIVSQEPTDIQSRFTLAFKHSEADNEDMALHHYLRIPGPQRNSTTWNNLGVTFEHFGMPVKAIGAYKIAANENETLAMSNLAFKLLQAGFIDEAQKECERALKIENPHKNIGQLLTRLSEVPDEENTKLQETQEKLKNKAAFYRKLGEAAASVTLPQVAGNWSAPDGILTITVKGRQVRMSGKFQRPVNAVAGLLAGALSGTQKMYTLKVDFWVEFRGQMGFGTVKREREGDTPTLIGGGPDENKVLMHFDGQDTLKVMERPSTSNPGFYIMDKLPEVPQIANSP